ISCRRRCCRKPHTRNFHRKWPVSWLPNRTGSPAETWELDGSLARSHSEISCSKTAIGRVKKRNWLERRCGSDTALHKCRRRTIAGALISTSGSGREDRQARIPETQVRSSVRDDWTQVLRARHENPL